MGVGWTTAQNPQRMLGKGYIHITGKSGYKSLSDEWNRLYPDDKKEFGGKDIGLLETDSGIAIKASMVYWKLKNLNQKADAGSDQTAIDNIGKVVNGSGDGLPNGYKDRRTYSKSAFDNLK